MDDLVALPPTQKSKPEITAVGIIVVTGATTVGIIVVTGATTVGIAIVGTTTVGTARVGIGGGGGRSALGAKKVGGTMVGAPPNIGRKPSKAELAIGTVVVIQVGSVGGRFA